MNAITFITVCFNDCDALSVTLKSLRNLSSTFSDFDHVIVDGGSTDGTLALLKSESDGDIKRTAISEPDEGLYDAMNKGMSMANGKYFCFLNAGDEVEALDFEWKKFANLLQESSVIWCCSYNLKFSNGKLLFKQARNFMRRYPGMPTSHQAMFFPALHITNGDVRYRTDFEICSDFDFFCKMERLTGSKVFIGGPVVTFHTGGKSGQNPGVLIRESMETFREYSPSFFLYPVKLLQLFVSITLRHLRFY